MISIIIKSKAVIAATALLAGCQTASVIDYSPAEGSGVKVGGAKVYLLSRESANDGIVRPLHEVLGVPGEKISHKLFLETINKDCGVEALDRRDRPEIPLIGAGAGAVLVGAVVAPAAEYLISRTFFAIERRAKQIEKANAAAYSASVNLSASEAQSLHLKREHCLLFTRNTKINGESVISLILLFKIKKVGELHSMILTYGWMSNSISETRSSKDPRVTLAAAVSTEAMERLSTSDLPKLSKVAGPTISLGKVSVRQHSSVLSDLDPFCAGGPTPKACPQESGLFFIPADRPSTLTIGLAESGSESKLSTNTSTEREALKAAVGAISSGVLDVVQPGPE